MKIKLKGAYANRESLASPTAPVAAPGETAAATSFDGHDAAATYPHMQQQESIPPHMQQAPAELAHLQPATAGAPTGATSTSSHPNFQPVEGSSSASASSSHADDDYLNAPLDLPSPQEMNTRRKVGGLEDPRAPRALAGEDTFRVLLPGRSGEP